MIDVSAGFKQAVYAPIRKTTAKISFEILENNAYENNESIVSSEAPISRKSQLTNKNRFPTHKYATFERNNFKLDGSFYIPPRPDEDEGELGWWSGELCGEDGFFTEPQTVEFIFTQEYSSMGLTIHFDTLGNEYATDFDIDVYREDGSLVHHESVTRNELSVYYLGHGLDNYKRILITIKKWARPYRRARIIEVDFGVIKEYHDDNLIRLSIIEEMNPTGDVLPANELKFVVDNSDRAFNILNPEGFYRFLREKQEVKVLIGVEIAVNTYEFLEMGRFFLTDWKSDEGSLTTTFTARNIIDQLEKNYIGSLQSNLYDLAVDILTKLHVKNFQIDDSLKGIPAKGFFEIISGRKALQYIGVAGQSVVYEDRQGILRIKRIERLDESTSYLTFASNDMFAGDVYPEVDGGFSMRSITFDNIYQEPQIELDTLVKAVEVVVFSYKQGEKQEVLNTSIEIIGTESIFFEYQNPVSGDVEINISGATTYTILEKYPKGMLLTITANGLINISVNGNVLTIQKTVFTLEDKSLRTGATLRLENPLIIDPEQAYQVGKWILEESRLRALYKTSWRQNPALECGDIVLVEDSYNAKKQSRIIKQEFNYAGYLSGKTESKGGV